MKLKFVNIVMAGITEKKLNSYKYNFGKIFCSNIEVVYDQWIYSQTFFLIL